MFTVDCDDVRDGGDGDDDASFLLYQLREDEDDDEDIVGRFSTRDRLVDPLANFPIYWIWEKRRKRKKKKHKNKTWGP